MFEFCQELHTCTLFHGVPNIFLLIHERLYEMFMV